MNAEIIPESTQYRPGETIQGRVAWETGPALRLAELRLFWFTRGQGNVDTETVETVSFDHPLSSDVREFSMTAPEFPFSFTGELISLHWALELILEPGESRMQELVIAPEGRAIVFHPPDPRWMQA